MNSQMNGAGEQLESAFDLFNQFSEKLADSYGDLESHVTRLTKELAEARNQRLIQLAEKEVLANRLEGLLDALPAGIVVLDSENRITQTNPVACSMLTSLSENSEIIGKTWKNIAKSSIITEGDELRLCNCGSDSFWDGRWVSVSASPITADAPNKGKIILISDITETRTLQNKLNQQQRLSSLGEMIASLAHQIRTPLSSALLYISTLNHPLNDKKERVQFAAKAKERLHYLERMVNDMLIFARGDVAESEYINVCEFMQQLKDLQQADNSIEKMQFVIDSNLKNVTIQANCDAVLSAIQNIIDNAIDACSIEVNGGSALIEINALLNSNNMVEITIKDNGCGMSVETKEKVLEPFFTTRVYGTGLGLAVVNSTVNRYAGEMTIHSEEGAGSCFTIQFPRCEVIGLLPSNLSNTKKYLADGEAQSGCRNLPLINSTSSKKSIINKRTVIDEQEVML